MPSPRQAKRPTKRATSPHPHRSACYCRCPPSSPRLASHLPLTHPLPLPQFLLPAACSSTPSTREAGNHAGAACSHAALAFPFPCSRAGRFSSSPARRLRRRPLLLQLLLLFLPLQGPLQEMQIGGGEGGCNGKEREGGDHKAASRQKKLKAKTFKWRSSNSNMKSKVEAGGSDEAHGDPVLCSVSTASFSSGLVSWKRVAEQCDAVDPPVPRKLRSAINKRAGRFVSASSRHVKKRRHLSAISAQISSVDQETSFKGSSLFTEEEEVIADVLVSLSQIPSPSELTTEKAMADSSNADFASTSCSEGATKEGDEIVALPSAANELANQTVCVEKVVEHTNRAPHVNPVPGATDQSSNINPPLSENEKLQDLSLATVVNLPSPSKCSFNNSTLKQQKVRFDDSQSYPAQKTDAPLWLVNSNNSDNAHHEKEKAKNSSAQGEIVPPLQTPRPRSPDGLASVKLASHKNTISESSKFTAPGNQDKSYLQHSLFKNVGSTKAWKRSITHVYVSHVIQMHMNKEKASQNQVKLEEERADVSSSRFPNGSAMPIQKNNASNDKFHAVHFPVQPSAGMRDMGADRQKIVNGNFLSLPTSTALPGTQQHLQYLHPQIAARGAMPMPYPSPHLPYSRGNLTPAAALQQMPQYMGNMGYAPRPSLPASSSAAMMKPLHQLMPTQQQQQQMWQYHVSQFQQPRPDATAASAAAAWQHSMSSLRPAMAMLPSPAMPAQMELFCAPYQAGGRQPQQLRLI